MYETPQLLDGQAVALRAFNALMWALSRPGKLVDRPSGQIEDLAAPLLDQHATFHASDQALASRLEKTGAVPMPLKQAEYVFADLSSSTAISAIGDINTGDLLQPDQSATLFAHATLGSGTRLRLSGPGISGFDTLAIGGVHRNFWQFRREVSRYPLGFDLYLVDGDRIAGLPRSTTVEIIE